MHFFSLDGVDWRDTVAKEQHYVGSAITDFAARTAEGAANPLEPVKKENIPRVIGSAALRMHDHNYISLPRAVADNGTPIAINNACASWHRLAETYAFENARMYFGTLFHVMGAEAHDLVVQLLDKHFGEPLTEALWSAQREVYGDGSVRRPYIAAGAFPQRLRPMRGDVPAYVARCLLRSLRQWEVHLARGGPRSDRSRKNVESIIRYYERELHHSRKRWPHVFARSGAADK